MSERGRLVVVSGPSGVGKDTVVRQYLAHHPEARLSVSATTRQPRLGERDGVDYYFVDRPRFEAMIAEDALLEHAQYNGNYYGTPRRMVDEALEQGQDIILVIEVQGAMQVRTRAPHAVLVFIEPPSFEVLAERLSGRGTETPEQVAGRMATARGELDMAPQYDHRIINDTVEHCCQQLEAVLGRAGQQPASC